MKALRLFLALVTFAVAVVVVSPGSRASNRKSTVLPRAATAITTLAPATSDLERDLQRAHAATAKYHSLTQAVADGYIEDVYESGEGKHYFHPAYYDDGVFDIEHPEALLYVPDENGKLRLAGLEYLVPYDLNSPVPPAPDGFSGTDDVWRAGDEGFPEWALNVWIWTYNPDGLFAKDNPLVP